MQWAKVTSPAPTDTLHNYFNDQGFVLRKYILIYIQQDATLHSLSLETALQVSGGISIHHQEHTQLYLQYLVLVRPLLLPAAIVEELGLWFQLFHDSDRYRQV